MRRDICLYSNECRDISVYIQMNAQMISVHVQTDENSCNTFIVSSERCLQKDWIVFHAHTLSVLDLALSPHHP